MKYQPRQHQILADEFLQTHDRGALFLDMGLGKTVIMLTHINRLMYEEFSIQKALVIAPKRVAEDTWSRECCKWEHLQHLRISKVMGNRQTRESALQADADIYVINRENIQWLVERLGTNWDFDLVCIDELSSFKSSSAKRWRMLRKVIFKSEYIYGLTGTPAPNGYEDLWSEIYLLDQGDRLGKTKTSYMSFYFYPIAQNGYVVYKYGLKRGAKESIDRTLSDLCLSMSKDDWLRMPPITYNTVPVVLSDQARELYKRFKHDRILPLYTTRDGVSLAESLMSDYDTAVTGEMAAAVSNKLLQMANGAVYDEAKNVFHIHDAKLDALEEIADTSAGQPILVFYTYKHDLQRLKERFPKARTLDNSETISAWNRGEIPMLLAHPASAGHGLNLQEGGHIIVWFGLPWSLELWEQANARLYRMGQEHPVICHILAAQDTLDERVVQVLRSKEATQKSLLDALKAQIKEDLMYER